MAELGTVYVDVKADYDGFAKKSKGAFLGIGKVAAGAFATAFAAVGVVDFFGDTIEAASDLNESVNAVNVTFGEAAEGILALGENAATTVGLSNSAFNDFAVQFSGFASQVAGDGGDVVGVIDDLSTRTADFASVMNLDLNEAAQVFQSTLAGQTEPIRKYGIDMSAAAVQAHALAVGIWDGEGAMTESEKVMARYDKLMQDTAKVSGDFANTSGELANQQRIASASYEDAKAKLGEGLLPIMTAVMVFVNQKLIPAIEDLAPKVQAAVDWVAEAWGWLQAKLEPIFAWIMDIVETVKSWFQSNSDDIVTSTQGMWESIQPILERIGEIFRSTFELVQLLVERFITVVSFIWSNFGDEILAVIQVTFETIRGVVESVLQIIHGIIETILGILTGDWDRAWNGIKEVFEGIWNGMVTWFEGIVGIVVALFGDLITGAWNAIKAFPGQVVEWGRDILRAVRDTIGTLPGVMVQFATDMAQAFLRKLGDFVGAVRDKVKSVFVDVPLTIIGKGWLWGSPSKVMEQLGADINRGLLIGLDSKRYLVDRAFDRLTPDASILDQGFLEEGEGPEGRPAVVNNFHAPVGGSMADFAEEISRQSAIEMRFALG